MGTEHGLLLQGQHRPHGVADADADQVRQRRQQGQQAAGPQLAQHLLHRHLVGADDQVGGQGVAVLGAVALADAEVIQEHHDEAAPGHLLGEAEAEVIGGVAVRTQIPIAAVHAAARQAHQHHRSSAEAGLARGAHLHGDVQRGAAREGEAGVDAQGDRGLAHRRRINPSPAPRPPCPRTPARYARC